MPGLIGREPVAGTWKDWLTSAGVSGVVRAVAAGTERSREAVTRYLHEDAASLPPAPAAGFGPGSRPAEPTSSACRLLFVDCP